MRRPPPGAAAGAGPRTAPGAPLYIERQSSISGYSFALRPISDGTLNAALRRLGYAKDEATSHGFRATASSLLNESGRWHPDAIERQLAHIEGDEVRAAYARGEHWDERVSMMHWWADYLDQLRILDAGAVAAKEAAEDVPGFWRERGLCRLS